MQRLRFPISSNALSKDAARFVSKECCASSDGSRRKICCFAHVISHQFFTSTLPEHDYERYRDGAPSRAAVWPSLLVCLCSMHRLFGTATSAQNALPKGFLPSRAVQFRSCDWIPDQLIEQDRII